MDPLSYSHRHCQCHFSTTVLFFTIFLIFEGVSSATFTFINRCDFTVWPGILGNPKLESTGFELAKGTSRSYQAPTGWSGRFWGRTGCNFDDSGHGACATGDCGSDQVECNGTGATPPATLAEFTLGSGSQDFYDVSLVDGYNLAMIVEASGGSGDCSTTGCLTDLNRKCPAELKVKDGKACRSACEAFGNPEYCCSGVYNSPAACKPSMYSEVFKSSCPKSYSYAYDDATSTFTCTSADYTITFCPNVPSLKSSRDSAPNTTDPGTSTGGSDTGIGTGTGTAIGGTESGNDDPETLQQAALASSWLASLATGDSTRTHPSWIFRYGFSLLTSVIILCYVHL
ncbi:hypothetical protein K2173_006169 [Erythroxylum novogranatense]|uniref:Uncharacterized protein n=1 Tax=Erythroxylum novogranatense TaxID=1862640 RepID=A0AAV8TEL3_9ROSI|nr:hypothetical protein K2173_006169 [Erythroxylum novogranatense]